MTAHHALAQVAALLGEPTRAAILVSLLDGRARPAGELARIASLSAAATSLHLSKLLEGGLLAVRKEGRHRYYRLASVDVAHALEALGVIASCPPPARSLSPLQTELRHARTCYDHLAGELAVQLTSMMERADYLRVIDERSFEVTPAGKRWLSHELAIEVDAMQGPSVLARRCLDWTERRPHLAGMLGATLFERLLALRWVARKKDSRALSVSPRGEQAFAAWCADPRARALA